jgi:hypothetical protein
MKQAGTPKPVTDALHADLVTSIVNNFKTSVLKNCEVPGLPILTNFGKGQLGSLISGLPANLQKLLVGVPGIGGVLNSVVKGLGTDLGLGAKSGSGGGGSSTGGTGGGGGIVKLPSLPRAAPSAAFQKQKPQQIDPFHLASIGLDPGIGTMLLQGVAEVR